MLACSLVWFAFVHFTSSPLWESKVPEINPGAVTGRHGFWDTNQDFETFWEADCCVWVWREDETRFYFKAQGFSEIFEISDDPFQSIRRWTQIDFEAKRHSSQTREEDPFEGFGKDGLEGFPTQISLQATSIDRTRMYSWLVVLMLGVWSNHIETRRNMKQMDDNERQIILLVFELIGTCVIRSDMIAEFFEDLQYIDSSVSSSLPVMSMSQPAAVGA